MNRRDFTTLGVGAGAALAGLVVAPVARAQGAPVEGRDYVKLSQRQPVQDPKRLEGVDRGELVEATYREAVIISVDKPTK